MAVLHLNTKTADEADPQEPEPHNEQILHQSLHYVWIMTAAARLCVSQREKSRITLVWSDSLSHRVSLTDTCCRDSSRITPDLKWYADITLLFAVILNDFLHLHPALLLRHWMSLIEVRGHKFTHMRNTHTFYMRNILKSFSTVWNQYIFNCYVLLFSSFVL